jgi:cytochrome c oxidase subunit III
MPAEAHVAEHFGTEEAQEHAAHLGMWVFIATEVLLFGGLFVCYAAYRFLYPEAFLQTATKEMELTIGTVNTLVLLVSSVLVAFADTLIRRDRQLPCAACLALAAALGVVFLSLKGVEYAHHVEHGALPGHWYRMAELPGPGPAMFMTLYFLMTGLHAVHMTVAVVVLLWICWQSMAGSYSRGYHTPVALGGMYWHLVDVIWVFLYPLFYLLSKR